MLKFLADENFNYNIVRGMLRRNPDVDIVRVQDVELGGYDDPTILEWAAQEQRVLLTHDVATITHFAYDRVRENKEMPGVFEVSRKISLGTVIEDLLLVTDGSFEGEWEGQVRYLPLR